MGSIFLIFMIDALMSEWGNDGIGEIYFFQKISFWFKINKSMAKISNYLHNSRNENY